MFALGVLVVILNYAGLLPGGVNNAWLIAAIGFIFVGLLLATRYHYPTGYRRARDRPDGPPRPDGRPRRAGRPLVCGRRPA